MGELNIENLIKELHDIGYIFEVYHEDDNKWEHVIQDNHTAQTVLTYLKHGTKYRYSKPENTEETSVKLADIELFKKLWYSRNPAHEHNADTGDDMFWSTAELIAREYCETLKNKPAEPLIVKSGGTWIAHWKGVDYLLVKPDEWDDECFEAIRRGNSLLIDFIKTDWKSFTGDNPDITELTDEIAKLRPVIVDQRKSFQPREFTTGRLWGISLKPACCIIELDRELLQWIRIECCRLATAQELK